MKRFSGAVSERNFVAGEQFPLHSTFEEETGCLGTCFYSLLTWVFLMKIFWVHLRAPASIRFDWIGQVFSNPKRYARISFLLRRRVEEFNNLHTDENKPSKLAKRTCTGFHVLHERLVCLNYHTFRFKSMMLI